MKIMIVSPFFSPICGGVEAVLDTTTAALANRGHEVQVITSSLPGSPARESHDNVSVLRTPELSVPENGIVDPSRFDFREKSQFFQEKISDFDADVVHFHNFQMRQYAMFLWAFLYGLSNSKIPTLDTIHNDAHDPFPQYLLSYLPIDGVIAVTRRSAIQLLESGVPADRVHVVPNMIDSERYRNANGRSVRRMLGVEEGDPLILFPSRMVGREGNLLLDSNNGKGLDVLIKALPEVLDDIPDAKVLLLGNDPVYHEEVASCKMKLKSIANKIGGGDRLLFFNQFVPNSMLPEIFAASDIVVSLSSRETFGVVFIEGMAAGKPVVGVSSNIGGVPEVVPDNFAGILVPPDDSHSTAKAISRILLNDDLRRNMGLNGIKWAKKNFDISAVIPRLVKVYEDLVEMKNKQAREKLVQEQFTLKRASDPLQLSE